MKKVFISLLLIFNFQSEAMNFNNFYSEAFSIAKKVFIPLNCILIPWYAHKWYNDNTTVNNLEKERSKISNKYPNNDIIKYVDIVDEQQSKKTDIKFALGAIAGIVMTTLSPIALEYANKLFYQKNN